MSSTDNQGSSLGSFLTSPPLYPHFNWPSGFWPCVKSCLVGGSDKYSTLISWHLISSVLPSRCKWAIVLRVEQYIPAPLRCFKCQKIWTPQEACRGRHTCAKCREKDPNHVEKDCLKEIRCENYRQDHPACARSCDVYKKEKEILEVKHKWNVSFLEARKIVGTKWKKAATLQLHGPIITTNIELLNDNLLYIIRIDLNVCKQMPDVRLLLWQSNSPNNLTVAKQMRKSKWND